MSQNASDKATKSVPVTVFGGLVTNVNPIALPLGASPDCSDITFLQESIASRPGFRKVFATPFGSTTVTYAKSFVFPNGNIGNLYLDSVGNIWAENLTDFPGIANIIDTVTPGSYCKSSTAFGREYMAFSDGLHSTDIPLQFDGFELDRVTQDGPGTPPAVNCLTLAPVDMAVVGAPVVLNVIATVGAGRVPPHGGPLVYTLMEVTVTSGAGALVPGQIVTIAGNTSSLANGDFTVSAVGSDGLFYVVYGQVPNPSGTGGTATFGAAVTMVRSNNVVTVNTAAAHNLNIGYQAQITGVPAASVGSSIVGIVIDNEDSPGLATITTASPHGLSPQLFVSLTGINGTSVGGGITAIVRQSQITTVTTATPHGLTPGGIVTISGVATSSFDTTAVVELIVDALNFTYIQVDVDASDTTGTVTLNWPVPNTNTPTYFQVVAAPTTTTFQIQVFYSDGAWSGGTVNYAWDGTFFVQSIPTTTSFTYQQYGPNAATNTVGVVTPFGQASPGIHQLRVSFITRQGSITPPSPPVQFVANGGQYISVTNIPIGPANVVGRILQFTGAQGAFYFYIPSTPQINGQIVGTATQINDNTTTSAILDFGDNTLFAALGVSIEGNNLAEQIPIDGALGFGFYGDRLITYGQRNRITNLLNMGFDGGYLPSAPTFPTGWQVTGTGGGFLTFGRYGFAFEFTGLSEPDYIAQTFFEDVYGVPIGQANTQYTVRAWVKGPVGSTARVNIAIPTTAFIIQAILTVVNPNGSWVQADFPSETPATITSDIVLGVIGDSGVIIDEISIIYTEEPYLTGLYASYVNNPEAFDSVTGVFGPEDDTHQVMDLAIIRSNLFMLTQDPGGRLHETSQGNTEPYLWDVNQVSTNCGAVSSRCLTVSQADDGTGEGGEEFFAWVSSSGIRIFGGQAPDKISQEIQRPKGVHFPGAPLDLSAINPAALLTIWGLNDPTQKMMWFGVPLTSASAPNSIFMMSYLGMDSAAQIAGEDPISLSRTGKMFVKDLSRKWAPWQRTMNGAALMYRTPGSIEPVFFGGNGATPGLQPGFGNVYTLDPTLLTDSDYGQFNPYYVTSGVPDSDTTSALQLIGNMFLVAYTSQSVYGVGIFNISMFYGNLGAAWPLVGNYTLKSTPFDLEFPGGNCQGNRIFFKFSVSPNPLVSATDNSFSLSSLTIFIKESRMRFRGSY